MKFYKIVISLLPLMALLSGCNTEKPIIEIELEKIYDNVYMLGAAPNSWDSNDPTPMVKTEVKNIFTYELDLLHTDENKLIKFCLSKGNWNQVDYLVPKVTESGKSYAYLKVGGEINEMFRCSEGAGNLLDNFWGVKANESGRYRLTVNPAKQTLTAERIGDIPQ